MRLLTIATAWWRYALAATLVLLAFGLTQATGLADTPARFGLLYVAVALVAWQAGLAAAVMATGLAVGLSVGNWFDQATPVAQGLEDTLEIAVFILVALVLSLLFEERRQAQAAWRVILNGIADAVLAVDGRGRVIFMSESAQALTGLRRDEVNGQPVDDIITLIDERTGLRLPAPLATWLAEPTAAPLPPHALLRTRDGREVPVAGSRGPVWAGDRRRIGSVLVLQDVSERRRSERALQHGEERLRLALAAGQMAVWEWHPDTDALVHSASGADIWGTTVTTGQALFALIHPEDRDGLVAMLHEAMARGGDYIGEFRLIRPDIGVVKWIEHRGRVILDEAGEPAHLSGILIDVTERRQREAALRLSEARFQTALRAAPVTVFNQDLELRYTWLYNPQREYDDLPNVVGKTDADLRAPEEAAALMAFKRRALETGQAQRGEFQVTGSASRGVYDLIVVPLRDETGQVVGLTGAAIDVTERKEAELAQRRLADAARRAAEWNHGLQAATAALAQAVTRERVVEAVARHGRATLGATGAVVMLVTEDGQALEVAHVAGWDPAQLNGYWRFPVLDSVAPAEAVRTGRPVYIESQAAFAERYPHLASRRMASGYEAAAHVPILLDGRALGAFSFSFRERRVFPPEEHSFLLALAHQCAQALERARLYQAEREARAAAEAAHRAARESQALLQGIIDGTNDAIYVKDLAGRYLLVNAAAAGLAGVRPEDMVGKTDEELLPPERARQAEEDVAVVLASGTPRLFESEVSAGGQTRQLHTFQAPFHDGEGHLVGVFGIARDVTALKRSEAGQRLLAEAGRLLTTSLEVEERLGAMTKRLVPELADVCAVYLRDEATQAVRLVAVQAARRLDAGPGSADDRLVGALAEAPQVVRRVMATGQPELYGRVDAETRDALNSGAGQVERLAARGASSCMAAPMEARGEMLGGLLFLRTGPGRQYTPDDLALADHLGRRAGIAVENARLYRATEAARRAAERHAQRTAKLQAITAALAEALTPAQVVETIVRQGTEALGARAGGVYLLDASGEALELVASEGYERAVEEAFRRVPLTTASPGREAMTSRSAVWIESNAVFAVQYPELVAARRETGLEALVHLPLILEEQRVLGTLVFSFTEVRPFNQSDCDFLAALARLCGQGLERTRLYEAERQTRARLAFLAEVGRMLAGSLDFAATLRTLARTMLPDLADFCLVQLIEEDGSVGTVVAAHIEPSKEALVVEADRRVRAFSAHEPRSALHQIIAGSQPLFLPELEAELEAGLPDEPETRRLVQQLAPRSLMLLPLRARDRTLGVMAFVLAESGRRYTSADLALAEEVVQRAALALDNARLFLESQQLNSELEARVQERTEKLAATAAALQAANQELESEVAHRRHVEEELRQSQVQLRQLSSRLEAAREAERARLAREIHDELGGTLTGLKMDVAQLQRDRLGDGPAKAAKLESMSSLIDEMVQQVRRIATDLRPSLLDDIGLLAALEWQLQDFRQRSGLECTLETHVGDDLPLDHESATGVFRVFQETLTNIARHAHATRVDVRLEQQPGYLVLSVRDNGRGITPGEILANKSLGLLGMRERVHQLAGELDVRGQPGQGTVVLVKIPLQSEESPAAPGRRAGA